MHREAVDAQQVCAGAVMVWSDCGDLLQRSNGSRLSCGAELEHSQMEFYNTGREPVTGRVGVGRRQLQALVRRPLTATSQQTDQLPRVGAPSTRAIAEPFRRSAPLTKRAFARPIPPWMEEASDLQMRTASIILGAMTPAGAAPLP